VLLLNWGGAKAVVGLAGVYSAFMVLLGVWLYPCVIDPMYNSFTPLPQGTLRGRLEALATKVGFAPISQLLVKDGSTRSSHSNAYLQGVLGPKKVVVYDTLLEENKAREDLTCAVVAHELGHWHHSHVPKLMVYMQPFALGEVLTTALIKERGGGLAAAMGYACAPGAPVPAAVASTLCGLALGPAMQFALLPLNAFKRRMEYEADALAVDQDLGPQMVETLKQLHASNKCDLVCDPLYSVAHHTHPTLLERIGAIEARMRKRR